MGDLLRYNADQYKSLVRKKNKYHAKRSDPFDLSLDGYQFDSKAEALRYQTLKLQQMAGVIRTLVVHPKFTIKVFEIIVCNYIGDFSYFEKEKMVVEDVKSKATLTPLSRLKMKLFRALYPEITLRVVGLPSFIA